MFIFLLLFSFLLHVITFILIKIMRDKLQHFEEIEAKQEQTVKQMEDLLAVYLLEIKEENEKIMQSLSDLPTPRIKEKNEHLHHVNYSIDEKDRNQEINLKPSVNKSNNRGHNKTDTSTAYSKPPNRYHPLMKNVEQDSVEQSLSAKIYSLYDQGNTVESIAKKLDCGKTEVELMLKFHRKNS